jgi:Icc-related predicted phosphoesterase
MPKIKGIGSPPIPSYIFLKDLKVSSGEPQPATEIASTLLKSLSDKQIQRLSNLIQPSPDLIATGIYLVTLEQELTEFEFTEEDVQNYLSNIFSLFSLVQMVNDGLIEVTHFPPIHSQEEFGSRLTSVGEKIAQILEEAKQ